ncbi:MAG: hypothetical protein ACYTAN_09375 [Planctomycetota bacterium]
MAKRLFLLLVVVSLLAVTAGCDTYNRRRLRRQASLRRVAIMGEQLRITHQDVDWVLGINDYPRTSKYHR